MRLIALLILTLSAALSLPADAQEPPVRVGRLAYVEGNVALFHEPGQGWEKGYMNSPVTSENSIWTDPGSRAEMRVSGIALRLDEATQLDIANLDDDDLRAYVPQGSIAVRVRHFDNRHRLDFATPHARFRLYGSGRYRLDVDPERDETVLTVFAGSASMRSSDGDVKIDAGRAIRIFGGAQSSYVREVARSGPFDRWTLARDEKWIERNSIQYVSTYMTGYEDLDAYGEWREEADFGPIWYPSRMGRDWVPYRDGHWDWVSPWGWTWIAYEPWGYAPYHYGRWVYVRDRWGWYPGPRRVERPVWAPALVAWVGGANFDLRVGTSRGPSLGWYPLSPWDRYDPWYRTNATYVNNVNIIVRDSPRDERRRQWREWTHERGATIVSREQFAERRPVRQAVAPLPAETIKRIVQAPAVQATTVLPSREEFRRQRRDQPREAAAPAPATRPRESLSPIPTAPTQPGQAEQPQTQRQAVQPSGSPFARERIAPVNRQEFERRLATPAPAPAPANQPPAQSQRRQAQPQAQPQQQQQQQQGQPSAPSANPMGRDDDRSRAAREAQQQERSQREAQQAQERAARDQRQAQERAQQAKERAAGEQQQQQRQQQQSQERQQRDAQQARERAERDAKQQQERAARDRERAQQMEQQMKAARDAQGAKERSAREAQQQQERAQRDAQQAQERAAREAQQAKERAAREAQQQQQQQQQRQAQERAQKEAQERAQKEAQEAQKRAQEAQRAAQPKPQPAPPAEQPKPQQAQPAQQPQGQAAPQDAPKRERGKGRDKDDDEKGEKGEKGKGRGRD